MGFEYGCFVSYMRPEHPMMTEFMAGLVEALKSEFEPFVPKPLVYLDTERLQPGFEFNAALAKALCSSACWIVVYVPQYTDHEYCLREYRAMQMLEQRRRDELGDRLMPEHGMIIPIILRGEPAQLPDGVGQRAHCLEFNRFTTTTGEILRNDAYIEEIGRLGPYIREIHDLGKHLKGDCNQLSLAELNGNPGFESTSQPFPGDAGARRGGEA